MNKLEKRALYSLLALYAGSIILIVSILGIWFYVAQKSELESSNRFHLEHIADKYVNSIIASHLLQTTPHYPDRPDSVSVAIFDHKKERLRGSLPVEIKNLTPGYHQVGDYDLFVSGTPREKIDMRYVVVASDTLNQKLGHLKIQLLSVLAFIVLALALLGWLLSRLFLRPIHQSVEEADHFTGNVIRESNPPITALTLSSQQAVKKYGNDKTILNIFDATRQLYNNYRSLAFLHSPQSNERGYETDLEKILHKVVADYLPICNRKGISLVIEESQPLICSIPQLEAELLFGNLISNAVRHSPAHTAISIWLDDMCFTIEDEGSGIDPKKQKKLRKRFENSIRSFEALGMSLSVIKRICNDYNIKLALESEAGQGANFELCFK